MFLQGSHIEHRWRWSNELNPLTKKHLQGGDESERTNKPYSLVLLNLLGHDASLEPTHKN
jgi:hypothetical protein